MRSRILELFGIERPIVGAGMIHVSTAGWAAAVADAGALGLIAGGHNTPESLRAEIRLAREMTRGALGVNVPLLYKHAPDLLRVCVEEDVRIVFTSAGNPAKVTPLLKSAGIINVHVVPSVRLAQKSVEAGVDAVVAEGYEAGGHVSRDGPTTLVLTRAVARAVEVPVIAAGGIADGAGVAAVMALGAEGAQIGTRLIATTECAVHDRYKRAIVEAGDEATLVTGVRLGPSRVLRNPLAEDIRRMDDAGHSAEEIHAFIGHGRVRRAACEGDMDLGSAAAGQGAALCDDVRPIADIIGDMMRDAKRCLESGQVRLGTG